MCVFVLFFFIILYALYVVLHCLSWRINFIINALSQSVCLCHILELVEYKLSYYCYEMLTSRHPEQRNEVEK